MRLVIVGKIVNTFGIKGELKVVSRFEMPEKVFIKGNKLIINNEEYLVTNVRYHHYNYLIELNNIKDINKIEYLKDNDIYFDIDTLKLLDDEYLVSELINYKVISNDLEIGHITDYDNNKINPLIKVNNKFYIPLKSNYIIKIDKINKIIYTNDLKGLML